VSCPVPSTDERYEARASWVIPVILAYVSDSAEEGMGQLLTIESLRSAISGNKDNDTAGDDARFEAQGKRYESAVSALVTKIQSVVDQIPELTCTLEAEAEVFTSPSFPGKSMKIKDHRIRITRGDDMLLFDPTAGAYLSALGQIEIQASRPVPFMIEKVLYLEGGRNDTEPSWGYRSIDNLGNRLTPFSDQTLLRMLKCVFA
jgi:hypothetical protein